MKQLDLHKAVSKGMAKVLGRFCLSCQTNRFQWSKGKNRCDICIKNSIARERSKKITGN